jgi:ferredoxin
MRRKIIEIDRGKCDGCGLCVAACHEGALMIVNGQAELSREDFCDGLGNCLPVCPKEAISFIECEAEEYQAQVVKNDGQRDPDSTTCLRSGEEQGDLKSMDGVSELRQWPVQLRLAPMTAPYYGDSDLLIAADCAAYARADFHAGFMRRRIILIGCPKLDGQDYGEKLWAIVSRNNIRSLNVVRMSVPCCGGLERAAIEALDGSGKVLPGGTIIFGTNGIITEEKKWSIDAPAQIVCAGM